MLDYALPGRVAGRGVLVANFGEGEDAWQLAVTHLSLGARSRQLQLAFLGELLSEQKRLVLMGDFNCDPGVAGDGGPVQAHPPAAAAGVPAQLPQLGARDRALDHILTAGFRTTDYRVLPAAGSDHLAVAITLDS